MFAKLIIVGFELDGSFEICHTQGVLLHGDIEQANGIVDFWCIGVQLVAMTEEFKCSYIVSHILLPDSLDIVILKFAR